MEERVTLAMNAICVKERAVAGKIIFFKLAKGSSVKLSSSMGGAQEKTLDSTKSIRMATQKLGTAIPAMVMILLA